ncbi:hypothetical protein B0T22DRAFT_303 [Podospora appendiculata]|uniref:LDB19 N-terminal domain-containing protein n=1 Tax=Podospora appendiculata TaxID=314037 RepID=A0AAE0XF05_9PEZI|nr:hypothetical protein B0T22DRAFT_303 [Podospora appendiculata]
MPHHRVTNFLRLSATSIDNTVSTFKKNRRRSPSTSARGSARSERVFSYASSTDDDADDSPAPPSYSRPQPQPQPQSQPPGHNHPRRPRMAEPRPEIASSESPPPPHPKEHHRLSFPSMHFGRSSKDGHANSSASLTWKLESPPIVLYGDAESSTGALVSGQLFLNVKDETLEFEAVNATLNIRVTQKKPFVTHCQECANQYTELKKWCLLPQPMALKRGEHTFPFSILLEGHLPVTVDGPLVSIAYEFKAEAVPKANGSSQPPIKIEKLLDVRRSLPTSELPHHSIRVFPPTNIKANVHYPHVIHPIGNNMLSLRLDGIAKKNDKVETMEYWKLKKLTWRLEETAKTVAPACEKHCPKAGESPDQQPKKGLVRTDTRVIGEKTIFSGWKNNYSYNSPSDSNVELEIDYYLAKHGKFACDSKSRDGTEVTHQLMVEMVVSQEWAPINRPALVTHTGVGRILRMHFSTVLTERAGIGISWDNEAPPIYQDVPPSPPAYSEETWYGSEVESPIDEMIEPLDGVIRDGSSRRLTASGGASGSASGSGGQSRTSIEWR